MSIFGWLTILYLLHGARMYIRERDFTDDYVIGLGLFGTLQIVFACIDGYSLYNLFRTSSHALVWLLGSFAGIVLLWVLVRWVKKRPLIRATILPLLLVIVLNMAYTEKYNGFYAFDNLDDFTDYHQQLKHYHHLTPFKVTAGNEHGQGGAELFEALNLLTHYTLPRAVQLENGILSYYELRGLGGGRWFRYDLPKSKQVL